MSERVFNLPNVITLLRIAVVPVVGGLAGLLALDDWRLPLFATVFVIAVVLGVQYVWTWGAKARRERVAARIKPH